MRQPPLPPSRGAVVGPQARRALSAFDSKRSHIFFATTDTCGNIGKDYARLISLVARIQHPGVGVDGKNDVDGLHSQAVFRRRGPRGRCAVRFIYL